MKLVKVGEPEVIIYPDSSIASELIESAKDFVTELHFKHFQNINVAPEDEYYLYLNDGSDNFLGIFIIKQVKKNLESPNMFTYDVIAEGYLSKTKNIFEEHDYGQSYDGEIIKHQFELSGLGINTDNVDNIELYNTYSTLNKSLFQVLNELSKGGKAFWLTPDNKLYFKKYDDLNMFKTFTDNDILDWGRVGKDSSDIVYRVVIRGATVGGKQIIAQTTKEGVSEQDAERYKLVVNDSSISDYMVALSKAQSILAEKQNVMNQVEFEVLGTTELLDLHPGMKIHLNSSTWGIDEDLQVHELVKKIENGLFIVRISAGNPLPRLETSVSYIDENLRQVIRSLAEAQRQAAAYVLSEPVEVAVRMSPIEPDSYSDSIKIDLMSEKITLKDNTVEGWFKVRWMPDRATFLTWRSIVWDADEKEGSIQVDVEDERGNTLLQNVSTPLSLEPYPPNMDFAESLTEEWGWSNGTLQNSFSAVFGTFSMKFVRENLTQEAWFKKKFSPLDFSNNAPRFIFFSLISSATGNIKIRLYSYENSYFERTLVIDTALKWIDYLIPVKLNEWSQVNSPTASRIEAAGVYMPADSNIQFMFIDAFRFEKLVCEPVVLKFTLSRPGTAYEPPEVRKMYLTYMIGGVWV
ncbi:MAG: hypothetical protein QW761_00240 [Candidatus Aenigmatarchaeota archaeon]